MATGVSLALVACPICQLTVFVTEAYKGLQKPLLVHSGSIGKHLSGVISMRSKRGWAVCTGYFKANVSKKERQLKRLYIKQERYDEIPRKMVIRDYGWDIN